MAIPKDFIILGLLGVALLFCIIGVAIPRWYVFTLYSINFYSGLWTSCKSSSSRSKCDAFDNASSRFIFIRAMEVLGMLLTMGSLVCLLLRKFVMKESLLLHRAIGSMATTAGVMMLVGCITYSTASDISASRLSAGFALCIVAGVVAIVGGVLQYALKEESAS